MKMLYMDCVFRAFNNTKPIAGAVSTNFSNRHIDILYTARYSYGEFYACRNGRRENGLKRTEKLQRERGENAERTRRERGGSILRVCDLCAPACVTQKSPTDQSL
ncbi:MAG: hypothetical protein IJF63_01825 [Alistipes sp.]|nr:hypothetical protein [Alistipes sp.]